MKAVCSETMFELANERVAERMWDSKFYLTLRAFGPGIPIHWRANQVHQHDFRGRWRGMSARCRGTAAAWSVAGMIGWLFLGTVANATAQDSPEALAEKVRTIFANHCGDCHRDSDDGGMNYVTDLNRLIDRKKVTPQDLEHSRVWIRMNMASDPMPPEGYEPRPTAADLETIKQWIMSLDTANPIVATETPAEVEIDLARQPVTQSDVIAAVHAWLTETPEEDRRYKRFFVLNHLHNLPDRKTNSAIGMDQDDLNMVRAAVSKAMNSLTWSAAITVPRFVDAERTVLAIDLRDYEWDASRTTGRPDLWNVLVQEYPYGLKHDQYPDVESAQRRAREIYQMTGSDMPWIRADWFVAIGLQPQNYHALLYDAVFPEIRHAMPQQAVHADGKSRVEQPMNAAQLYEWLKVDVIGNVRRNRAARAGFTRSGVSSQPRLLERHPALYGAIWNSYDFKPGSATMNLLARPLGPDGYFDPMRFNRQSFEHDGGEYIYGLPNGLHGFLLSDAAGKRINFGPSDVVEDRNRVLGNSTIVNGVSCIACHKQGLITDFRDEVRFGVDGLPSQARRVVRNLYLDRSDLDDHIDRDQVRYRAAAMEATLPFLSDRQQQAILAGGDLVEPVAPVAKRFLRDTINIELMAVELGVEPNKLKTAIEFNDTLQRLGLVALTNGGTISREIWESGAGTSAYQRAAQALRVGTPVTVQAEPWRGGR
jgi:mono/diheme cytochrome c family protein